MNNLDIRQKCKESRVRLWEIAERMGVCDMTLSRHLRHELNQEEKNKIFTIIDELARQRDEDVR